ncbi:MAG: hypothetical protein Tsb0013_02770 [Phycisphaerales bacterium]
MPYAQQPRTFKHEYDKQRYFDVSLLLLPFSKQQPYFGEPAVLTEPETVVDVNPDQD